MLRIDKNRVVVVIFVYEIGQSLNCRGCQPCGSLAAARRAARGWRGAAAAGRAARVPAMPSSPAPRAHFPLKIYKINIFERYLNSVNFLHYFDQS